MRKASELANKPGERYWWHKMPKTQYIPDVIKLLTKRELKALLAWFDKTDIRNEGIGECTIPAISFITSLINGNGISKIVQIGNYTGYSSLFLASTIKRMGGNRHIFSIDIDPWASEYADKLMKKAGTTDFITHHVSDSVSPDCPTIAKEKLGGEIELIFIDSDHTYIQSMKELQLWWPELKPGGFMILHDSSQFATSFGSTPDKGVKTSVAEFFEELNLFAININQQVGLQNYTAETTYLDGCGLTLVQKPFQKRK